MSFDLVEEPQPPIKKWVDPEIPGVTGQIIAETDVLIEFETMYGMNFVRCPIALVPNIVPAMIAVYNANLPVITPPTEEEPPPANPEDPPVDIGTGDSNPEDPIDIGTDGSGEVPADGDVLVNPIDNGNVGTEEPL